jgi:oxygen-independent coproporphyrinogen-3 oxidase
MNRVLGGQDPAADHDRMTPEAAARERIVVGLRRRDGIERGAFRLASGFDFDRLAGKSLRAWVDAGWAADDGQRIRLTRSGMLLSDGLWGEVLGPTAHPPEGIGGPGAE